VLPNKDNLTKTKLRTPKAAAIAGIRFSILSLSIHILVDGRRRESYLHGS